jgi:hypothetical protein
MESQNAHREAMFSTLSNSAVTRRNVACDNRHFFQKLLYQ